MRERRSAIAACILVLVVGLVLLAVAGNALAAPGPTVVVGTANDLYAPFEYPIAGGAKSIGFDNDLVTAIAKRAGFVVVQRTFAFPYIGSPPGPWADCDMVAAALSPFPVRRQYAQFSDLYFDESPHGQLVFCFPKTRAGTVLCAQVNLGLAQVKADGTWARIYVKWFGVAPASIP